MDHAAALPSGARRTRLNILPILRAATCFVLSAAPTSLAQAQCGEWATGLHRPGTNGRLRALETFDDGTGSKLYAAGAFTLADDVTVENIARWDGAHWSGLPGLDGAGAALCVFDDGSGPALYVGGTFSTAGGTNAFNIARWNGSAWSNVGAGFDGAVLCLSVWDDGSGAKLYAGGSFTTSGATTTRRLARWDGTSWSEVGGGLNAPCDALAVWNGALFAGGEFTLAGATSVSNIARWDGSAWSALGSGTAAAVLALAEYDDGSGSKLFVGGEFLTAGGISASFLARWDGAQWSAMSTGLGGAVRALRVSANSLYAGGTLYPGATTPFVVRFIGASMNALAGLETGGVYALGEWNPGTGAQLEVGGDFQTTGDAGRGVARRSGGSWHTVGNGLGVRPSDVAAMTEFRDGSGVSLVIGGGAAFGASPLRAGTASFESIARFDGVSWNPMGSTPLGSVLDFAQHDDGTGMALYACGALVPAVGSDVVRWDGVQWQPVGNLASSVWRLAVHDDGSGTKLYAGGDLVAGGGGSIHGVARWDGASWSQVGTGHVQYIEDFQVLDTGAGARLYAAGIHETGFSGPSLRGWDGSSWSYVFAPFGNAVIAELGAFRGELYAAYPFGGGGPGLMRWDGTTWSSVGAALDGSVSYLRAYDDGSGGGERLIAAGTFTHSGATALDHLGAWDGNAWTRFGGGLNGPTTLLGEAGGDLYVVGVFDRAGGVISGGIARWRGCAPVHSFCAGDGLDPYVTTACPCGNTGGPGRGCAWSNGPQGASLAASGGTNPDTLVLAASGMPAVAPTTIFLKGDALIPEGIVFGDGVRCIAGNLIRLGTKTNVAGAAQYPEPGNAPISVRGNTPPGSGAIGYYQTYFRNAATFCTPSTFNVTNAVRVLW